MKRSGGMAARSLLAMVLVASSLPVGADGKAVYDRWCIDCHGEGRGFNGEGLTGTVALAAKYEGRLPAVLHQRTDLTPAFVALYVRRGVSVMPFFRKTEITDAELAELAAWLSGRKPR